jgi:hypothetical protein
VDLAARRRTKWAEKSLLGALWGYTIDVSETFRTVSEEEFSEVHGSKRLLYASPSPQRQAMLHPFGAKTRRLSTIRCTLCIKGSRLVTARLPEKSSPIRPRE